MDDLETRIKQYISNELFDDGGICVVWVRLAITLCIEANVLSPDSKWNLWIARALYQQKEYRRCVVCLEQCPKRESWYYLTNNCHCSLLLAKCFFHLGEFDKALSYLQDIDVFVLSFHQSRMKRLWMPHSSS